MESDFNTQKNFEWINWEKGETKATKIKREKNTRALTSHTEQKKRRIFNFFFFK